MTVSAGGCVFAAGGATLTCGVRGKSVFAVEELSALSALKFAAASDFGAAGTAGFGGALSARGCETGFGATGGLADPAAGDGAPMRSLGKRIPQKPTTDSVNSSSTYPLTLR